MKIWEYFDGGEKCVDAYHKYCDIKDTCNKECKLFNKEGPCEVEFGYLDVEELDEEELSTVVGGTTAHWERPDIPGRMGCVGVSNSYNEGDVVGGVCGYNTNQDIVGLIPIPYIYGVPEPKVYSSYFDVPDNTPNYDIHIYK